MLVRTLQFSHGDSQLLSPADEVDGRYCFQSCLSVHICRQAGGWHSTDMRSKYHFMIFTLFVNIMILIEGVKIVVFNKPLFVFAFALESKKNGDKLPFFQITDHCGITNGQLHSNTTQRKPKHKQSLLGGTFRIGPIWYICVLRGKVTAKLRLWAKLMLNPRAELKLRWLVLLKFNLIKIYLIKVRWLLLSDIDFRVKSGSDQVPCFSRVFVGASSGALSIKGSSSKLLYSSCYW